MISVHVHLQQKKKRGQVVKINKEFRISQKRPRASQSSNSTNKSNCLKPECNGCTGRCHQPVYEETA